MTDQEENEKEAFRTLINEIAMKNNPSHSFTEGSEPIKLTEAQRIEREAAKYGSLLGYNYNHLCVDGYVAGATAEGFRKHSELQNLLNQERNKAIDEARHEIALWLTEPGKLGSELMERITALKADSK